MDEVDDNTYLGEWLRKKKKAMVMERRRRRRLRLGEDQPSSGSHGVSCSLARGDDGVLASAGFICDAGPGFTDHGSRASFLSDGPDIIQARGSGGLALSASFNAHGPNPNVARGEDFTPGCASFSLAEPTRNDVARGEGFSSGRASSSLAEPTRSYVARGALLPGMEASFKLAGTYVGKGQARGDQLGDHAGSVSSGAQVSDGLARGSWCEQGGRAPNLVGTHADDDQARAARIEHRDAGFGQPGVHGGVLLADHLEVQGQGMYFPWNNALGDSLLRERIMGGSDPEPRECSFDESSDDDVESSNPCSSGSSDGKVDGDHGTHDGSLPSPDGGFDIA